MTKKLPYLMIALLSMGCGNLKDALQELKERGVSREAKKDIADQGRFALEANEFIDLGDDSDAITGEDDLSANAGGASASPSLSGIIAAAEMPGNADITYYECSLANCLPSKMVFDSEKVGKLGMGSVHAEITFNYFETVTAAQAGGSGGATNNTPRASAGNLYIRAEVIATSTITKRDAETATLTTTGHRVWAANRALWYVVDLAAETTGFPARPNGKPGVTSVSFTRQFAVPDVNVLEGASEKVLTFSDDTTRSTVRHFSFDAGTRHMSGTWTHTGRKGFLGLGTFDMNIGETPFCRLDDVGTISIERTYGESSTSVTSEQIEMTQDGLVLNIAGTLTLTDGSTKTKTLTRTQTQPTTCGERGEGLRSFTVTGTGYGGNEISFTESRTPGNVTIHAVRTMADTGNVQTLDAVRTQGVLQIQASVSNAAGEVLFEAQLVLHPGGDGVGQVSRLVEGKMVKTHFSIDDGKIIIEKPDGTTEDAV